MLRTGLLLPAVVVCFLAAAPRAARADEPPDSAGEEPGDAAPDPDTAYKSALADMAAKKYDRACPALRASYRLDPRADVLFNVAKCEDGWGKTATALSVYDDYLALFDKLSPSEQKDEIDREEQATVRREALARVLSKVTLRLPEDAPAGVKITRASRDGVQVPLAVNVPLPVDPGEVVVRVQVPGRPDWEHRFVVKAGEQRAEVVPVPRVDNKRNERAARVGKPLEPVPSYMPALEGDSQGQRIAAYVAAGIGVAGIVAGAISGTYTLGQKGSIENNCQDRLCNPTGEAAKDTAATTGLVSTVTFAVGGAALAAGVILYLTAPAPAKLSAIPTRITARPSGLEVTWQW